MEHVQKQRIPKHWSRPRQPSSGRYVGAHALQCLWAWRLGLQHSGGHHCRNHHRQQDPTCRKEGGITQQCAQCEAAGVWQAQLLLGTYAAVHQPPGAVASCSPCAPPNPCWAAASARLELMYACCLLGKMLLRPLLSSATNPVSRSYSVPACTRSDRFLLLLAGAATLQEACRQCSNAS